MYLKADNPYRRKILSLGYPFTIDVDEMTLTLKIKRKVVEQKCADKNPGTV